MIRASKRSLTLTLTLFSSFSFPLYFNAKTKQKHTHFFRLNFAVVVVVVTCQGFVFGKGNQDDGYYRLDTPDADAIILQRLK